MRILLVVAAAALAGALPLPAAGAPTEVAALQSWSFTAAPGELLEIQLRTGAGLRIIAWDKDEVSVVSDWAEERCRDVEFDVRRTGEGVRVATRYAPGTGTFHPDCSFAVEARVPRRYDVQIRSAGGSVAIQGLRGGVRGQTGGGQLELSGLRGTVVLRTGGGQILVRDSDLEGRVSTGGGRVRFDNVSGGLTGRSGSMRKPVRGRSRST